MRMTKRWIENENPSYVGRRPHAFLELELVRRVTLQSQGDSLRGPNTISKDHQLTDLTLAACPPPFFPVSGLAASRSRSCGLAEWGSENGDRGPGPGGSAARTPSRGSGFLPRRAPSLGPPGPAHTATASSTRTAAAATEGPASFREEGTRDLPGLIRRAGGGGSRRGLALPPRLRPRRPR